MLEQFYFLFEPNHSDWELWNNSGFIYGFIILIGISLLTCIIYYTFYGRRTDRHKSIGKWFLSWFISSLVIFIITVFSIAYGSFENIGGIGDFNLDIWIFSLLNATIYSIFIFFILSLVFRYFSIHYKDTPISRRIFKKK